MHLSFYLISNFLKCVYIVFIDVVTSSLVSSSMRVHFQLISMHTCIYINMTTSSHVRSQGAGLQ